MCLNFFFSLSGVQLNGRNFRQGNHCEYVPYVSRRGNVPGPGGFDGSSDSHKIGTVVMFYIVPMTSSREHPSQMSFVSIIDRPVLGRIRSMFRLNSVHIEPLQGFSSTYDRECHTLIQIDSVAFKVMIVPHYDFQNNPSEVFAIRMWESR